MTINNLFKKGTADNGLIQIFRFVVIGGITATLDFVILYVLVEHLSLGYFLAAAIGFIIGSSLNYYLSIKWVFLSGKYNNQVTEFSVFIFFTFLGLLLNQLIMYLGADLLMILYLYCKLISIFIVTVFNFITKKYIVFVK